jgi:hypothetical protein
MKTLEQEAKEWAKLNAPYPSAEDDLYQGFIGGVNNHSNPPQSVIDKFKEKGIVPYKLEFYSYPCMFGSTAGPFGGIGGAAMSNFQVQAYVSDEGTVYKCRDLLKFSKKAFNLSWP